MDKNEQLLKMEELRNAMRGREFDKAAEIADSLELKKIKDTNFLSIVADAYERTRNYEDAKKALEIAYEKTNAGRLIAYKLCLIAVKTKDFEEAKKYYEDFIEMAPRDTARYILKYRMARAQGEPIESLIEILEEYVNLDMEEKWAYELAKLYHKAGETEKCVDICDEISLWFSEGKYVNKAMELKLKHAPLTPSQQEKYDENKMREEEKLENAEVKEIQLEENKEEKKRRRPFEINPNMINREKTETKQSESKSDDIDQTETDKSKQSEVSSNEVKISGDMEEIVLPEEKDERVAEKVEENESESDIVNETEKDKAKQSEETDEEVVIPRTEKLTGIKDVSDILKQLQERGILKAETVQQAVEIIDEADGSKSNEINQSKTTKEKQSQTEPKAVKQVQESEEPPVFDDSDIIYEEDLEPEEKEEKAPVIEETDDVGSTRIFDKVQVLENGEIVEQPKVSKVVKPPVQKADEKEYIVRDNGEDAENVPVLDLDFETPERDESNDIGQKNMYENIAANSDLGYKTDKLPTREELQAAIKKAEQAVANKEASREAQEENAEVDDIPEVRVKENPTSKVEILAGAGIVEEGEVKQSKTELKSLKQSKAESEVKQVGEPSEEKQSEAQSVANQSETETETKQSENQSEAEQSEKETEAKQSGSQSKKAKRKAAKKSEVVREDILSEAELTEFKNYLNVEGFETNIREVLQELIVNYTPNGRSDEGNVIIMGNEKTGKTTLAIEMIKLVNRKRGRRNRRLAKVDAGALNRKGFRYAVTKLVGSDLIVENADQLGKMTVSELIDVSGMFTDDMLIVLEGDIEGMERLIKESPRLETVFNHVVRIKEYDIKEWVEYGKQYAEEKGYTIDELANLAFYKAIDDFFGANKGIGQADVEGIIDGAIEKSGRIGRKVKGIFGSKTDDEGLIVLQESDFDI